MFGRMRALFARLAGSSHPIGQDRPVDVVPSLAPSRPSHDHSDQPALSGGATAGPPVAEESSGVDIVLAEAPSAPRRATAPSSQEELAHAQRLLAAGKVNRAISLLEARMRVAPDTELVTSLSDLQTIHRASKRLQRHPQDPQAHFELGRALFSQEQGPQALGHLEITCHLRPGWQEAHLLRAYELHWEGRWQEAEAAYGTVLKLDPAHVIARRGLLAVRVCQPPDALVLPHELPGADATGIGFSAAGGGR